MLKFCPQSTTLSDRPDDKPSESQIFQTTI